MALRCTELHENKYTAINVASERLSIVGRPVEENLWTDGVFSRLPAPQSLARR
jgi:hypothetical protein